MNENEDITKLFDSLEDEDLELIKKYRINKPSKEEIKELKEHLDEALKPDNITQEEWEKLERGWFAELDKDLERDYAEVLNEIDNNKDEYIEGFDGEQIKV